jgi:hypothetical protein
MAGSGATRQEGAFPDMGNANIMGAEHCCQLGPWFGPRLG